mgnify:CR=1 FL=1
MYHDLGKMVEVFFDEENHNQQDMLEFTPSFAIRTIVFKQHSLRSVWWKIGHDNYAC